MQVHVQTLPHSTVPSRLDDASASEDLRGWAVSSVPHSGERKQASSEAICCVLCWPVPGALGHTLP
jgi:hypothetical protein